MLCKSSLYPSTFPVYTTSMTYLLSLMLSVAVNANVIPTMNISIVGNIVKVSSTVHFILSVDGTYRAVSFPGIHEYKFEVTPSVITCAPSSV